MKVVERKRVADYVEPRLSSASVERMWSVIAAGEPKRPLASRWWLLAAAAALIAVMLGVLRPWSTPSTPTVASPEPVAPRPSETWLATGAQSRKYPLGNSGELVLAPSTQVRVDRLGEREIRLRLERGRIDCSVSAGDDVVVRAGPAEMHAGGGAFHVELEMRPEQGPMLRVGVDAGRVDLKNQTDGERLALLGAGQTWTNVKLSDDEPSPPAPDPTPPRPTAVKLAPALPTASAVVEEDAAQLLASAQRQRKAGNAAAAAADYDRLRKLHPGDARAGLAAFELARIRLDQLGDPRGALEAFDAALTSGKGGFFVEDAEAGRIRALAKLKDQARCSQARAAFLKAHPKSPHVAEVRRLCNAP
ncbi:MAG: FecR domain-containing protein [Myxococcales bacterium]|nr:FecR domain-containing protein [Myxococcales bacterium]